MKDDALFVMQRARSDNSEEHAQKKKHGIIKATIKEAKQFPEDQTAAQFLQITADFKASKFREMFGPAGKPNNSDIEYLYVKVLFRTIGNSSGRNWPHRILLVSPSLQHGPKPG